MIKNVKGITLIALVITIVVLIILAGVSISILMGENGIINKASKAKIEAERTGAKESLSLVLYDIKMEEYINGKKYTQEKVTELIMERLQGSTAWIEEPIIKVEINGYVFDVDSDLNIIGESMMDIRIKFEPSQGVGPIASTKVTLENIKKEVDESTIQYQWGESKTEEPTGNWTNFNSGDTITKDITGQTKVYYLWVKAKDTEAIEIKRVSGKFNDIDETIPTITLTKTGDVAGAKNATIKATVTSGFSGIQSVKYLEGNKTIDDFKSEGKELISDTNEYTTVVTKSAIYTFYIKGNNGKEAISTIQIINIIDIGWQSGIANVPVLTEGMVPIKWNGSTWEVTTTTDPDWYKYIESSSENATKSNTVEGQACRKWANVMLKDTTKSNPTFAEGEKYTNAELGSMFVWIPRYSYKITSNEHTSTAGTIAIKWSDNTNDDVSDDYIAHPAFNFGGTELKGIWVAKFEASGSTNIKIAPNVTSWRSINISTAFNNSRNMEKKNIYGWEAQTGTLGTDGLIVGDTNDFDVHMLKNTEWGAVLYLSHSLGKTGDIKANASNFTTGGGNYQLNITQSSTENVYGIYDMSGGGCEYVMGVLDGGINTGRFTVGSSGFSSGALLNQKYYDIYDRGSPEGATNNYVASASKKGHGLYEVSNSPTGDYTWYRGCSEFIYASSPWFARGRCLWKWK